jgi:hypothetical protein
MQIDLLATKQFELGLVSDTVFHADVSCVIFDVAECSLTLEFGVAMDSLKLNVPVSGDYVQALKAMDYLHVCAIEKGRMAYAKQVPLMKVSVDEDDLL